MADDIAPMSVKDRIARLKLDQVGRAPGANQSEDEPPMRPQPPTTRPRPPPPPPPARPGVPQRPTTTQRSNSSNLPPIQDYGSVSNDGLGNLPEKAVPYEVRTRPSLPPRTSTQSSGGETSSLYSNSRRASSGPSPALPPRIPSESPSQSDYQLSRKPSTESMSSVHTTRSSLSGVSNAPSMTSLGDRYSIRAPAYNPANLPVLPPRRTDAEKDAYYGSSKKARQPLKSVNSSPNVAKQIGTTPPPSSIATAQYQAVNSARSTPSREQAASRVPPTLPARNPAPPLPNRSQAPPPPPTQTAPSSQKTTVKRSALDFGMNKASNTPPVIPSRPNANVNAENGGRPPPIPTSSRPDLAALQASKPKPGVTTAPAADGGTTGVCLHCRDFSAPDQHAARFPRQSIPSTDIGWLAHQLTSPFPSATDKARAIFTWLHHNVEYDVVAFFGNNVKPSSPQGTLQSGLAVCEGYAGLFTALAIKAGLESYVVGGHGKGYGYSKLKPGDPIPPYEAGHAWNVVKIDDGEWKLIDPCWGAGNVSGAGQPYSKHFSPERFTQTNEDFGADHFPDDSQMQFRNDGRVVTWEEYITGNKRGCGADFFTGFVDEEGLASKHFKPTPHDIVLAQQGPTTRFSFQKICPHWDPVRCGKGPYYLYILALEGLDGTDRNHIPFETNGDAWWCDVPTASLGKPGQAAQIFTVTTFGDREGRGLTIQEYRQRKGRVGMSFGGVCKWQVA